MEKGQNIIRNLKRHSDGTFTSDFTRYLDKIKAKDFVEWLASTERKGWAEKQHLDQSDGAIEGNAEVTVCVLQQISYKWTVSIDQQASLSSLEPK